MAQCKPTSFNTGLSPSAMAFDGNNLWVVNSGAGTVTKYSVATNSVTATVGVGTNPVAAAFDGTYVWVVNQGSNNISRINVNTNAAITVSVGSLLSPYGIAFDGTSMWVTSSGAQNVVQYSIAATATVLSSTAVTATAGVNPYGIVFDGNFLWIAANDSAALGGGTLSELIKFDPATNVATHNAVTITGQLYHVATDGVAVYATDTLNSVVDWFDASTISLQSSYLLPLGSQPSGIVFDGNDLWVAGLGTNTVTRIDARHGFSNDITALTGSNPAGVLFDGDTVWVANGGTNTVQSYHP